MIDLLQAVAGVAALVLSVVLGGALLIALFSLAGRRRRGRYGEAEAAEFDDAPEPAEGEYEDEEDEEVPDADVAPGSTLDYAGPPGDDERVVALTSGNNVFEIDLMAAKLADAGVWCFVSGDHNALGPSGLATATLHVRQNDRDRAARILDEVRG